MAQDVAVAVGDKAALCGDACPAQHDMVCIRAEFVGIDADARAQLDLHKVLRKGEFSVLRLAAAQKGRGDIFGVHARIVGEVLIADAAVGAQQLGKAEALRRLYGVCRAALVKRGDHAELPLRQRVGAGQGADAAAVRARAGDAAADDLLRNERPRRVVDEYIVGRAGEGGEVFEGGAHRSRAGIPARNDGRLWLACQQLPHPRQLAFRRAYGDGADILAARKGAHRAQQHRHAADLLEYLVFRKPRAAARTRRRDDRRDVHADTSAPLTRRPFAPAPFMPAPMPAPFMPAPRGRRRSRTARAPRPFSPSLSAAARGT